MEGVTKRPRDGRRSKVYDAERQVSRGRRFNSISEAQEFIDGVLRQRWFRSRWGVRRVPVVAKHHGRATGQYGGAIELPAWSWCEAVALHELAHVLISSHRVAAHGKEWVACYLLLVRYVMGNEHHKALRAAMVARNIPVQAGVRALPLAGTFHVETKAAYVAQVRARTNRPVTPSELEQAADIIRRAVKQGHFGPAGRKPRLHALETARGLC